MQPKINSVKSSTIINGQMKAGNTIPYQPVPAAINNTHQVRTLSSSIPINTPNLFLQNYQMIANIPPLNPRTIRPIINPSI
jgi:hypothetical protein